MKCAKLVLLFFLFLSPVVYSQDVRLQELFNQHKTELLNLNSLVKKGQLDLKNKNSLILQQEEELKNYEESMKNILNQNEQDLKRINSLLIASQGSLKKEQTLSKGLSRDLTLSQNTSKIKDFWLKISLSVLVAMTLIITVETIIIIKRK